MQNVEPKGLTISNAPGDADRPRRVVRVEAPARPPDRPEHHRADALDRADRHRRRALETRFSSSLGTVGADLADRRPVRPGRCCRSPAAAPLLMLLAAGFFVGGGLHRLVTARLRSRGRSCSTIGALMLFDPAGDALSGVVARGARDRRHAGPWLFGFALNEGGPRSGYIPRRCRGRTASSVSSAAVRGRLISSSSRASSGTPAPRTPNRWQSGEQDAIDHVEPDTLELVVGPRGEALLSTLS